MKFKQEFNKWQLWAQYLQAHDAKGQSPSLTKAGFFKMPLACRTLLVTHLRSSR